MKCKKCGFEVTENDLFCANCGAKVEIEPNKKPNNKMKLIIAAIVVVICAGGIGFFLMNNNNDEDKADFDELLAAGVLTSTDESKKIVYVSLDETIKQQENSGLVCKKQ